VVHRQALPRVELLDVPRGLHRQAIEGHPSASTAAEEGQAQAEAVRLDLMHRGSLHPGAADVVGSAPTGKTHVRFRTHLIFQIFWRLYSEVVISEMRRSIRENTESPLYAPVIGLSFFGFWSIVAALLLWVLTGRGPGMRMIKIDAGSPANRPKRVKLATP
jgi:hypothetical protein